MVRGFGVLSLGVEYEGICDCYIFCEYFNCGFWNEFKIVKWLLFFFNGVVILIVYE